MIYVILGAFFCALVGSAIGSSKNRSGFGFFLGFLLGPIGVIVIALLPGEHPRDFADAIMERAAPPLPPATDPTAAILDLKKLLDARAISEAEFETKKRFLLDQIGRPARTQQAATTYRIPGLND